MSYLYGTDDDEAACDEEETPLCPGCGKPWHYGDDPCPLNPWRAE